MRWSLLLVLLLIVGCSPLTVDNTEEVIDMRLTSNFSEGEMISSVYTCDGANSVPPLMVEGVPAGVKSLVLIMDDPDIPAEIKAQRGIEKFDHWILFNIDPSIKEITATSGITGKNGRGENSYTGPCPPPQYQPTTHRYYFKLYGLDVMLDLSEGVTKKEVEDAMKGHVISETVLIGKYDRS